MEKHEIRIGNHFNHNGNWNYANHNGNFIFSESDWHALGECTLLLEDVNQIPLKDWLDKFGLNKYNIDGFRFLKVGNFSFEYSDENNILYINGSGTKIKYVHQLQNAIFDLTEQIIL